MFSDLVVWFKELDALYQILIGIFGFIGVWEFRRIILQRFSEHYFDKWINLKSLKSNKSRYKEILKKEVDSLNFIIPGLGGKTVNLSEETFVHLRLSKSFKSEQHIQLDDIERHKEESDDIEPGEILHRAFETDTNRVLLIVGDPGSGKTTLIKYFIKEMLSKKGYKKLNLNKPTFPFLFYLRNLKLENDDLYKNLEKWTDKLHNKINADFFKNLLTDNNSKKEYYLFLDGIDEAGDRDNRKKVCQFIKNLVTGLPDNVKFVVTTRYTGIIPWENINLIGPHMRANLKDFNKTQKIEFLKKWLKEVSEQESGNNDIDKQVEDIIDYIYLPGNKAIKEITGMPIMLNLLALIWYKFKNKPANRSKIFRYALEYLLEFRDDQKDIQPLVENGVARKILQPISLNMQKENHDEIETDEFEKTALEKIHTNNLKTLANDEVDVNKFCEHMIERASIIAKQGDSYFIFKHKSFREYFAGVEIEYLRTKDEIAHLVNNLKNPWWLETTKHFFENISGINGFNLFFKSFFKNKIANKYMTDISSSLIEFVKLAPFKNEKIFEAIISDEKDDNKKCMRWIVF